MTARPPHNRAKLELPPVYEEVATAAYSADLAYEMGLIGDGEVRLAAAALLKIISGLLAGAGAVGREAAAIIEECLRSRMEYVISEHTVKVELSKIYSVMSSLRD